MFSEELSASGAVLLHLRDEFISLYMPNIQTAHQIDDLLCNIAGVIPYSFQTT